MPTQLEIILDKIKSLEQELLEELQKQQEEFTYTLRNRRIHFEKNVILRQKTYFKQTIKLFKRCAGKTYTQCTLYLAVPISRYFVRYNRQLIPPDLLPDLQYSQS